MAGPRKPTAILELVGAFKHNPQRRRDNEPECLEDVMLPPFELSEEVQQAWDFLVATCVDGVLTKMDSAYLMLCAQALSAAWKPDARVDEMHKVGNMLGKLGMTPADRSKIIVPKKQKANPFAAYQKA